MVCEEPRCLVPCERGCLRLAGDVGSPVPDVPSPGARNNHNGQPVAEPGEGAEGTCGGAHLQKGRASERVDSRGCWGCLH